MASTGRMRDFFNPEIRPVAEQVLDQVVGKKPDVFIVLVFLCRGGYGDGDFPTRPGYHQGRVDYLFNADNVLKDLEEHDEIKTI